MSKKTREDFVKEAMSYGLQVPNHMTKHEINNMITEHKMSTNPAFNAKMQKHFAEAKMLKNMILRLSEAQNHRCCYCGCETYIERIDGIPRNNHVRKSNLATIEHIVPRSKGGNNYWHNLAMSCQRCNSTRGSTSHHEFIKMVRNGQAFVKKQPDQQKVEEKNARAIHLLMIAFSMFPKAMNEIVNEIV